MEKLVLIILSIVCSSKIIAQNKVLFFQTDWGFEGTTEVFIKKAKISGYDGIEIWSPIDPKKQIQISKLLKEHNMKVIFLCSSNSNLPFENSLSTYKEYLKNTIELNPVPPLATPTVSPDWNAAIPVATFDELNTTRTGVLSAISFSFCPRPSCHHRMDILLTTVFIVFFKIETV